MDRGDLLLRRTSPPSVFASLLTRRAAGPRPAGRAEAKRLVVSTTRRQRIAAAADVVGAARKPSPVGSTPSTWVMKRACSPASCASLASSAESPVMWTPRRRIERPASRGCTCTRGAAGGRDSEGLARDVGLRPLGDDRGRGLDHLEATSRGRGPSPGTCTPAPGSGRPWRPPPARRRAERRCRLGSSIWAMFLYFGADALRFHQLLGDSRERCDQLIHETWSEQHGAAIVHDELGILRLPDGASLLTGRFEERRERRNADEGPALRLQPLR